MINLSAAILYLDRTRCGPEKKRQRRIASPMFMQADAGKPFAAHVLVLGNEKGGSGKSTVAMHVAVALMKAGQRVATIDLDSRQKSFTHYIEHRAAWAKHAGIKLEIPAHFCVDRADGALVVENENKEFLDFAAAVDE